MMKDIGIIPAAGLGTRLSPLPFSKELYPIGFQNIQNKISPAPISQHLVHEFKQAHVENIFCIINSNKTDILKYYQDGHRLQVNFSYLIQREQKGMVEAISKVTSWLPEKDYTIYLGMPDTIFQPPSFIKSLKNSMDRFKNIDVLLGVFPTTFWYKLGMVEIEQDQEQLFKVHNIIDKPKTKPNTDYAWGLACWRDSFQVLLSDYVQKYQGEKELVLSDVFVEAKRKGLNVYAQVGESYTDIGTVDELKNNHFNYITLDESDSQ